MKTMDKKIRTTMILSGVVLALAGTMSTMGDPQDGKLERVPMSGVKLVVSDGQKAQPEQPKADTSGEAMPGSQTEPGKAVAGKVLKSRIATTAPRLKVQAPSKGMAELLAKPQAVRRGDLLPTAQLQAVADSRIPTQLEPVLTRPRAAGESHLAVVLRVRADGTSEVVSATEVPGPAPISDEPRGDFLYEVKMGGRAVAVEALPDPFEAHSFGGPPGTPQALHHFQRQEEATVVVKVPKTRLDGALDSLSFELFQLESGAPLERVDPTVLEELKRGRRLKTLVSTPAQTLAPQIRQQGVKLQPESLQVQ